MKNTITSILLCLIVLSCKNPEKLSQNEEFKSFIIIADTVNIKIDNTINKNVLENTSDLTIQLIKEQLNFTLLKLKSTNQSSTFEKFSKDLSSFNMVSDSFNNYFRIIENYTLLVQIIEKHKSSKDFKEEMNKSTRNNVRKANDNISFVLKAITDESINMSYADRLNLIKTSSYALEQRSERTIRLRKMMQNDNKNY